MSSMQSNLLAIPDLDLTGLPKGTKYISLNKNSYKNYLSVVVQQPPQKRTISFCRSYYDHEGDLRLEDPETYFLSFPYTVFLVDIVWEYERDAKSTPTDKVLYRFDGLAVGFRDTPLQLPEDFIARLPLGNYSDRLQVCLGSLAILPSCDFKNIIQSSVAGYWSSSFTEEYCFRSNFRRWIKEDEFPDSMPCCVKERCVSAYFVKELFSAFTSR